MAARGIDVSHIAHVVNYDLPGSTEDFVHRIGRTGRASAKGVATTFVLPQERSDVKKMERELKAQFDWREVDSSIQKEERNQPIDIRKVDNILGMETRSWKNGDAAAAPFNPHSARTKDRSARVAAVVSASVPAAASAASQRRRRQPFRPVE